MSQARGDTIKAGLSKSINPQSAIRNPQSEDPRIWGTMNRIFSSVDSMFVAIYYAVVFLTPANVRGAARLIADCGLRIADFARSLREVTSPAPHMFCGLMLAAAPCLGPTA